MTLGVFYDAEARKLLLPGGSVCARGQSERRNISCGVSAVGRRTQSSTCTAPYAASTCAPSKCEGPKRRLFKVWGVRRDFGLFGAVRARARMLALIRLFRTSVALFGRRTAPSRVGNKPKPARSVQCRREPCQVTWGISVVAPKACVDFARGRKTIITNHCRHITAAIQDCAQQHNSTAHRDRDIRHPTLTPFLPHFHQTFTTLLPHFSPTPRPHKCRVKPPNVRVSVFVRAGTRATGRVKAHLPYF